MVKLLTLVRQKRNLEEDLIIIKVYTGLIEQKRKVTQQRLHEHYGQHSHNGIHDWQFMLTEQYETHELLKERETFWQYRLKTFYPYGLNEKKECLH